MIRKIKFRGKCREKGYWVYGDLLGNPLLKNTEIREYDSCLIPPYHADYPVDPDTIGQYIGFNDCDDEEVYEGDLLRDDNGHIYVVKYLTKYLGFCIADYVEVMSNPDAWRPLTMAWWKEYGEDLDICGNVCDFNVK